MDPKRKRYLYIGGAGVAVIFLVMVYRARQKQAAAAQTQVQTYPVGLNVPDNTQATGIAALLALLGGGGGAPGSVRASRGGNPTSFYAVSMAQAQRLLDQGGGVYYQAAPGTFVPTGSKLSILPAGTQLYGSSLISPTQSGQTLGTPT